MRISGLHSRWVPKLRARLEQAAAVVLVNTAATLVACARATTSAAEASANRYVSNEQTATAQTVATGTQEV